MSAVTVHVQQAESGWWRIMVTYPGSEPHTLLSVRTRTEAERAARGYAARYGWTLDVEDKQQ